MKRRQKSTTGDPTASRNRYARRRRTSLARGFAEDGCFPTAVTFPGSAQLDLIRLFGTLRLAEWAICLSRPLRRPPWTGRP